MQLLHKSQEECSSLQEIIKLYLPQKKCNCMCQCNTVIPKSKSIEHDTPRRNPEAVHVQPDVPPTADAPQEIKAIPKPRKNRQPGKPKLVLLGDSMVRDSGAILAAELPKYSTCVLSK